MKDIKERYFKKLYVSDSNIAGKGLFTSEEIHSGELILMFGGDLLINSERYSGSFLRSTCVGISEDIMIGEKATEERSLSDYINHSCNPNVGLEDAITIVAISDIPKDSELFCDYSFWENDDEWFMKVECHCGSINCRKHITGKDWKNVSQLEEKFKFYSPYIQRRIIGNEKK